MCWSWNVWVILALNCWFVLHFVYSCQLVVLCSWLFQRSSLGGNDANSQLHPNSQNVLRTVKYRPPDCRLSLIPRETLLLLLLVQLELLNIWLYSVVCLHTTDGVDHPGPVRQLLNASWVFRQPALCFLHPKVCVQAETQSQTALWMSKAYTSYGRGLVRFSLLAI